MSSFLCSQMIGLITITSIGGAAFAIAGIFFLVQHSQQNDHRISTQRYVDSPSPLEAPRTPEPATLNSAPHRQRLASIPEESTTDLFPKMRPPRPRISLVRVNAGSNGQKEAVFDTLQRAEKIHSFHAASLISDCEARTNDTICQGAPLDVSGTQRYPEAQSLSLDTQGNQGSSKSPALKGSQTSWKLNKPGMLEETEQGFAFVPTHHPCLEISGIGNDHKSDPILDWTQFAKDGFP